MPPRILRSWLALAPLLSTAELRASRSGLNNIPTADVSPPAIAVVHLYSAWGPGRDTSFLTGVRSGLTLGGEKLEAGLDSRWAPGEAVPVFFNGKWARNTGENTTWALGVAGLVLDAPNRHRFGQPQSYGVVTHDFRAVRITAGYAGQAGNDAWFAGLDRKFMVFGRPLVVRSDAIEIQHGGRWLTSVGLTYRIGPAFGLELWRSHPTGPAREYTTVKFACFAPF